MVREMPLVRRLFSISSLAGLAAALALAAPAAASAAYVNPFAGASAVVGRTDMGVDLCLNPGDPIRAIGDGTVIGIQRNWYAGQPYIWYELSSGPHAGAYVYVAEQIDHLARVGQTLAAGDVIARYATHGSCIETGWSMADGETEAAARTGYTEGQPTQAGISFAHFLISVGVSGQFQLTAPKSQATRVKTRHRKPKTHGSRPGPDTPSPSPRRPKQTPKPGRRDALALPDRTRPRAPGPR